MIGMTIKVRHNPNSALLYERRDQSMICSNCDRVYQPDSITHHKTTGSAAAFCFLLAAL
jgi:hypothetical protein